jgi:O-antigen/teichoic acid export membrane protein
MGYVPRALGVSNYGIFNFTTAIITKFYNLIEFKSSTYFYTKFSQDNKDSNLFKSYLYFLILIFILLSFVIISIVKIDLLKSYLFLEVSSTVIIFSLFYIILNAVQDFFINLLDAQGLTIKLEKLRIGVKIFNAFTVYMLYSLSNLNLLSYFVLNYITCLLFIIPMFYISNKQGIRISLIPLLTFSELKLYSKQMFKYISPLVIYLILTFVQDIFDRWFLQKNGGSIEQGYYSFSFYITNLSFIFISALFPLFTREISICAKENNISEMGLIFSKFLPFFSSQQSCTVLRSHHNIL